MSIYELGEIIRWKSSLADDFDYGMVIKKGHMITAGIYSIESRLTELIDNEGSPTTGNETLMAITAYSFREQRVITIYRNPEDVPLLIEKVKFSKKTS